MSGEERKQGGLSVKTLVIAGAASAAASLIVPVLWRPGTVFAAAMTPVIVALVTELLRRPVDTVESVAVRRTDRGTAIMPRAARLPEPFDPLAPPPPGDLEALPPTAESRPAVHRPRRRLTARQWRLALITGLVAFAAVVAAITASELVAGGKVSAGRGGDRTTFFGGRSGGGDGNRRDDPAPAGEDPARDREREPEPTATPAATPTPDQTATPAPTATPLPEETPPPAAAPPADTAPAPAPAP